MVGVRALSTRPVLAARTSAFGYIIRRNEKLPDG